MHLALLCSAQAWGSDLDGSAPRQCKEQRQRHQVKQQQQREGGEESWDSGYWTQEASLDSSAEMLMDQKASLWIRFLAGSLLLKHSVQR